MSHLNNNAKKGNLLYGEKGIDFSKKIRYNKANRLALYRYMELFYKRKACIVPRLQASRNAFRKFTVSLTI